MANNNVRKRSSFTWLSTLALGGGLLLGCGAEGTAVDYELEQGEIIGGSAVSNATMASLGLLRLGNGCSGSLLDQNTAMTATHCTTLGFPTSNTISAMGTDGLTKTRTVSQVVQVGTSDITLYKLGGAIPAGWPTVNRTVSSTAPANLVNTSVTCYGQGATGYAAGGGFSGGGAYRQVTKTVTRYNTADNTITFPAVNGSEIIAPGDSGGVCLSGSQPAGVHWYIQAECTDQSTPARCGATATKVLEGFSSATNKYKAYIDSTKTRSMTTFRPLTLSGTWTNAPYVTTNAAAALVNGFVYLRGGIWNGNASTLFTLPAGYRPSHRVYLPINLVNSTKGRLTIETTGAVTVYAEGGTMSNAYAFTSLEGVSFAVAATPSTAATMLNGWGNTAYGTRPVAARADGSIVRLQGAMSTTGTNTTAFTLHSSFWPSKRVVVPVDMYGGTKGRITIDPNGSAYVTVESGKPASNAFGFTSLEGVAYNKDSAGEALGLYNGWTTYPGLRSPTVTNRNGIVNFQGVISTSGSNMTAFYLPEQYRPATNVYVEADLCNAKKGRLLIQPDGWVSVQYQSAIGDAQCLTSLEGVQFGL